MTDGCKHRLGSDASLAKGTGPLIAPGAFLAFIAIGTQHRAYGKHASTDQSACKLDHGLDTTSLAHDRSRGWCRPTSEQHSAPLR